MPELGLAGWRSRPLAAYLKCLGLLRVLGMQADAGVRGRWRGGHFELSSTLDLVALQAFFLDEYAPSPVVSPWNGASGFFAKDRTEPLEAVAASTSPRLAAYRETIACARQVLERRDIAEEPQQEAKAALVRELRRVLPDDALDWLDTAIVLTGLELGFPPLLGSGGNDGHFDFSNNYMGAVAEVLREDHDGRTRAAALLEASFEAIPVPLERKLSLAHFERDTSPVNSPSGESDSLGNPWDLVLALEGSLVLCAGAARRHGWELDARLVAPFTAQPTAAGYGSARSGEQGRAEIWLPLWRGWSTLSEIEALAHEARAQVGRRWARSGLDFVRAAGELGVARGIFAFERYAILQRAGGRSSLAVPAGQISVAARPAVRAIRSLDNWLDRVLRYARGERAPRGVAKAARAIEQELFAFADAPTPERAGFVLEALGDLESALAVSARRSLEAGLRPLDHVPAAQWLEAADDGSAEFAVASAIASLWDPAARSPRLRDYVHGTHVDDRKLSLFDPDRRTTLARRTGAVARLAAIHARRHLDAARAGQHDDTHKESGSALGFPRGLACDVAWLHAFALGRLDDERVMRLIAGLCLLDFGNARLAAQRRIEPVPSPALDLLVLAWEGPPGAPLGPRPGWAARLAAGQVRSVLDEATLRLRLADLPPLADAADLASGAPPGQRLAAALLPRVSPAERAAIARRLIEADLQPQRHRPRQETT